MRPKKSSDVEIHDTLEALKDEITQREVENMSPEQVDRELRAHGIDPEEAVARLKKRLEDRLKVRPRD